MVDGKRCLSIFLVYLDKFMMIVRIFRGLEQGVEPVFGICFDGAKAQAAMMLVSWFDDVVGLKNGLL